MSALAAALARAVTGARLDPAAIGAAFAEIMAGKAESHQLAAFLAVLAARGEAPDEIAAAARALRQAAVPCPLPAGGPLLDTCGTGGDGLHTPNISTMVALVAAAGGVRVAKHGNRSVSSRSGSADVLEALGIPLDPPPERLVRGLEEAGIAFLFAPRYHPGMRHAAPVRKALGIRTLFNILGPLANPAPLTAQVLGVFRPALTLTLARTLAELGLARALVVHGSDGMDELTTTGPTRAALLWDGQVRELEIDPAEVGIPRARPEALAGGDARENAGLALEILAGGGPAPLRDLVALNAGAALWIGGRAASLRDGTALAQGLLAAGAPGEHLTRWRRILTA